MGLATKALVGGIAAGAVVACTLAGTDGLSGGSPATAGDGGADVAPHPSDGAPSTNADGSSTSPEAGGDANVGPPKFVNSSTAEGTTTNKLTIQVPGEALAGDFLMATIYSDLNTNVITAPDGWTTRKNLPNCYSDMYWAYAYAQQSGARPVSFTFTDKVHSVGAISVYRGVAASSPFDADLAQTYASQTYALPSLTTTTAQDLLLVLAINDEGVGQSWSGPSNLAKRLDNGFLGIFDTPLVTAGPTPTGKLAPTGDTPCGSVEVAAIHP